MRGLLLCLVVASAAQVTQAQNAPRSYQLKDKTVIRAEIRSVDQARDRVEYQWFAGGGSGVTARKLTDFSPHSQFNMIRSGVDANDSSEPGKDGCPRNSGFAASVRWRPPTPIFPIGWLESTTAGSP